MRNFRLFLVSLVIACLVWVMHTFALEYSATIPCTVRVNTSLKGYAPSAVSAETVLLRGRASGFYILRMRKTGRKPVELDITVEPRHFKEVPDVDHTFTLPVTELRERLGEQLGDHFAIDFIDVEQLTFTFEPQSFVKVPVVASVDLDFRPQYMQVGEVTLRPDSVLVYGAVKELQRITQVRTRPVTARKVDKTLQGYVDAVLYRDIIERHEVPSVQSLRYTLEYIKHNFAHKISTRAISGVLKGLGLSDSREYIADYLDWLEQAYLIYRVPVRTDSLAVRRMNPDKFYLVDTGLARAVTPKSDASLGWLLENLVFLALRRSFNRIEYYNTKRGDEVDFLVTDMATKKRRLVQVSWALSSPATEHRELAALADARKEINVDDCTIVTWDEERDVDGIRIVPAWKWCLEQESKCIFNELPRPEK